MGTLLANHNVYCNYGTEKVEIGHNKQGEAIMQDKKYTECVVVDQNGKQVATAKVRRHHEDKDIKIVARKYAFREAMLLIPDKNKRKEFWNDFRDKLKH